VTLLDEPPADPETAAALLVELYDRVLPDVYGYLLRRCGSAAEAEELTSQTFLAAAAAVKQGRSAHLSVPWLMTVARNKLVDHWRRQARYERALRLTELPAQDDTSGLDPIDEGPAIATLQSLNASQRAALTLRHLDGLSVPEVAQSLGRSTQATDALLSRARAAFRRSYPRHAGIGAATTTSTTEDREEER